MLQSFSSVVGPNGSGKSNVIDAMLFVFGKKAKQVMRAKSDMHCTSTVPMRGSSIVVATLCTVRESDVLACS